VIDIELFTEEIQVNIFIHYYGKKTTNAVFP